MRDLDLRMESDEPGAMGVEASVLPLLPAGGASAPKAALSDLTAAHEMLLRDLDEVRRTARLVAERMEGLDAKLSAKEASAARQGELLERVTREGLAEASREWAETAARFRKFVDDMGSLAAWQEMRARKVVDPWRHLLAAMIGALLGGLIVLWLASPTAARLRGWIVAHPRQVITVPADQPPAPVKGRTGGKGSPR